MSSRSILSVTSRRGRFQVFEVYLIVIISLPLLHEALLVYQTAYSDRVGYPSELHTPHSIHTRARQRHIGLGICRNLKSSYHFATSPKSSPSPGGWSINRIQNQALVIHAISMFDLPRYRLFHGVPRFVAGFPGAGSQAFPEYQDTFHQSTSVA